jgi:glycosyltransferase involved in cell wall biosynthesis
MRVTAMGGSLRPWKLYSEVGGAMKNILFVSIAFPPKADAEGMQVAKYLKYMLRESKGKFNIDAVTSQQQTLYMSFDASLASYSKGIREVIEVPIYENRYSNWVLRKLAPRIVNFPDSKFSFHLQAGRVVKGLKDKPHLIYSRSFPPSSAVMAYKLKTHYKVPWIMHLSDLWADSPEVQYGSRLMSYQQEMEGACFKAADVVCVTSEMTQSFYERKYGKTNARIEYYPNVFDMDDYSPAAVEEVKAERRKLRIVHAGSLVGDRSPGPFLQAVKGLPKNRQDELDIVFIGDIDSQNRAIFNENKSACVTYAGTVEFQKSLDIQRSADVLLLIDTPIEAPELRVFFRSKILDYMVANRPILAIVDNGSEVQSAIAKYRLGTCIDRHDHKALADHLLWLLDNREGSYFEPRELVMEFDAALNAKRLVDLFDEYL